MDYAFLSDIVKDSVMRSTFVKRAEKLGIPFRHAQKKTNQRQVKAIVITKQDLETILEKHNAQRRYLEDFEFCLGLLKDYLRYNDKNPKGSQ